jgi:hypothetical protein
MVLSESSYIVGENDLNEFRENIERQNNFLDNEISRFKPTPSFQDLGSIITTIALFITILGINKDIFLKYWIQSTLIFLIFTQSTNSFQFFKMTKVKIPDAVSFQSPRQLNIAYFLSLKAYIMNTKYNDIAFCIMWAAGFFILIYNLLNMQLEVSVYLVGLFFLIFLLSAFLMYNNEELYDFLLWVNTKIVNPSITLEYAKDKDIRKVTNNFNWSEILSFEKSQAFFMLAFTVRNLLILVTILMIFFTFLHGFRLEFFKDIFLLSIFQILMYVTLASFLSFKKIEELLEKQKNMLIRSTTFLDKLKPRIDRQQLNDAKNYLNLSKLFLGYRQNFAIFFTWIEIKANGELNIEENYDLLYRELGIPLIDRDNKK